MTKLTLPSWSFSSLMVFETCPYRTKLERLDKVPDNTPRPAADRGTQIHQEAEDYVTGKGQLTHNLRHFNDDLAALRAHHATGRVVCEEEWGFDRDWNVAPWRTAWLRLKCDVVCQLTDDHIAVVDHKGLERSTLIPTPSGWTTMGEIKVGDELFSQNGQICKVTSKSQIKNLPCYEIKFDDTTVVRCDNEHLWALSDGRVLPVTELKEKMHVNVCRPIDLPHQDLPIHPYVLGIWLADGKKSSSEITKPDRFIFEQIERCGYTLSHNYSKNSDKCRVHTIYGIRAKLAQLNLLGNKHIPQSYMRASFHQRLSLLQGLMDGDGSVNQVRKQVILQSTDEDLSKQYLELILSLGQRALRSEYLAKGFGKYTVAYPISFRPININPFLLPRKAERCKDWGHGYSKTRRIVSIKEIPSIETQCIAVDSEDHTFLCTERFLPTHNTGKRFGNELKHAQQLQLYALCTLLRYPQVEKTTNELWYIDQNELADFEMRRSQLSRYLKVFDKRARKMTECTDFTPNPNAHSCKWCPYAPHKQGNCPHGVNPDEVKTRGGQPLTFSAPKNRRPSAVDKLFEKD